MAKLNFILHHIARYKYAITGIIGALLICIAGENSLYAIMQMSMRAEDLRDEIAIYDKQDKEAQKQLRELGHNPRAIRRVARERYFMKEDDEDVFLISSEENVTVLGK